MGRIHVGTSGYTYPHWKRVFYPDDLPGRLWLSHYASVFSSVELRSTYARHPNEAAMEAWQEQTPPWFIFSVQGRRIGLGDGWLRSLTAVEKLGVKLGPVLWQVPEEQTTPDLGWLADFLARLPNHHQYVFELRSAGWYTSAVAALLERYHVAFGEHDGIDLPVPAHTGAIRYLRFHGTRATQGGRYGERALEPYARDLNDWVEGGRHAFVYFRNDLRGSAVLDALDLIDRVGPRVAGRPHEPAIMA